VDPGKYTFYHCDDLDRRWKELVKRETELRGLMEKANETAGGAIIGSIAYRSDYDAALFDERLLQRAASDKKCPLRKVIRAIIRSSEQFERQIDASALSAAVTWALTCPGRLASKGCIVGECRKYSITLYLERPVDCGRDRPFRLCRQ
jgi:hypothetical protein